MLDVGTFACIATPSAVIQVQPHDTYVTCDIKCVRACVRACVLTSHVLSSM